MKSVSTGNRRVERGVCSFCGESALVAVPPNSERAPIAICGNCTDEIGYSIDDAVQGQPSFAYIVDGREYMSRGNRITGIEVAFRVSSGLNDSGGIFEEGFPDRQVRNLDWIYLDAIGTPRRFYSVPKGVTYG